MAQRWRYSGLDDVAPWLGLDDALEEAFRPDNPGAADSLALNAWWPPVSGSAAATISTPTSSASGAVVVTGTSAGTISAPTQSADGAVVEGATGTANSTLAAPTQNATGTLTVSGSSAATLSALTQSADGALANVGTAASMLTAAGTASAAARRAPRARAIAT
jgi:hypothetical protein